jgi:hypothetical protein
VSETGDVVLPPVVAMATLVLVGLVCDRMGVGTVVGGSIAAFASFGALVAFGADIRSRVPSFESLFPVSTLPEGLLEARMSSVWGLACLATMLLIAFGLHSAGPTRGVLGQPSVNFSLSTGDHILSTGDHTHFSMPSAYFTDESAAPSMVDVDDRDGLTTLVENCCFRAEFMSASDEPQSSLLPRDQSDVLFTYTHVNEATDTQEELTTASVAALEPSRTGVIVVEGDADKVFLRRGYERYAPGAVPPGVYYLDSQFGEYFISNALGSEIIVAPGETVRVHCRSRFTACKLAPN